MRKCLTLTSLCGVFFLAPLATCAEDPELLADAADGRLLDEGVAMISTSTGQFDLSKYQALVITCTGTGQDVVIELHRKSNAGTYLPFYVSKDYRVPQDGRIAVLLADFEAIAKVSESAKSEHLRSIERIAVRQTRVSVVPGHTPVRILKIEGVKSIPDTLELTKPSTRPKGGGLVGRAGTGAWNGWLFWLQCSIAS